MSQREKIFNLQKFMLYLYEILNNKKSLNVPAFDKYP